MLKDGSPHMELWSTLVDKGNAKGGMTAAQLEAATLYYHPQVLADLQRNKLVAKRGKIGNSFLYVGDPNGKGIIPQTAVVEVELYECADGTLATRTKLLGAMDSGSPVVKYLTSRKITIDVPGEFARDALAVAKDVKVDPEYNYRETLKAKRAKPPKEMTIDAEAEEYKPSGPTVWVGPDMQYLKSAKKVA